MTYTRTSARAVFLSAALALATVFPAHAGFEWKGPIAPPPSMPAAPVAPAGEMSGLEPVITWDGDMTAPGAMPAVRPEEVEKVPVAAQGGGGEILEGFASSVPLVIALQQVTPPGYRVSFSPGVDPGAPVSWSGGRPWKSVLSDMLAVQGLSYKMDGDAIVVSPLSAAGGAREAFVAPMPPVAEAPIPLMPSAVREDIPPPPVAALGAGPQSVSIRRQKPASFIDRLGLDEKAEAPLALGRVEADVAEPAVTPPAATPSAWHGARGQTLRAVLKNWSDAAGVDLYWSIDYDYRLEKDVSLSGNYDEAVASLLDKFSVVRPQPYGKLHQAAGGPKVLVIKSYGVAG